MEWAELNWKDLWSYITSKSKEDYIFYKIKPICRTIIIFTL